ncbi:hypothetical protein B0H16DRAFT_1562663 [Mycena metata]|uniref:Uncharacterized protein n=1 Tax=Mycena metata TaxID=1033252 RepID=A0AAD7IIA6_9AGAR|nr:hypothetical protein B0H16DRAFT_1562663 [Mycena metata]
MGRLAGITSVERSKSRALRTLCPEHKKKMLQNRLGLRRLPYLQGLQIELRSSRTLHIHVHQGRVLRQLRGVHGGVPSPPTERNTRRKQITKSNQKKSHRGADHKHRTVSDCIPRQRSADMWFLHSKPCARNHKWPTARAKAKSVMAGIPRGHQQKRSISRSGPSIWLRQRQHSCFAIRCEHDDHDGYVSSVLHYDALTVILYRRSQQRPLSSFSIRTAPRLHRVLRVVPGGSRYAVVTHIPAVIVSFSRIPCPLLCERNQSPVAIVDYDSTSIGSMYYVGLNPIFFIT